MSYWTPEEIVYGLNGQDGSPTDYIIDNMLLNFERQARAVLTDAGYGVQECYLTPNEPEIDRQEWLNEAFHLLDDQLPFELEQAALSLIEQANIRHYIEEGDASSVAISMAKLVAITLLPNNTNTQAIIQYYKNRPREIARAPKQAKSIRAAYEQVRKQDPDIRPYECWFELCQMAGDEAQIKLNGDDYILGLEDYQVKNDAGDIGKRIFAINDKTGLRDGRKDKGVTEKTIRNWFTEDNK